MSKLTIITDRAMDIASHAGESLRHLAPHAGEWVKTGAAVGAVKTGGKAAAKFARRNPAAAVALVAAGVGLIGWVAWRNHKKKQAALALDNPPAIEGLSQRLELRRPAPAVARPARTRRGRPAAD